jgi:hypothetical protein
MLAKLMTFLTDNPEANSFAVAETFGLSRGMCERLFCQLEDMGFLVVEKSGGCSSGGCSSGGCSTGGCSTASGPAAQINALAAASRAQKQPA